MKNLSSMIAAALIASASFAGAALADGDYYQGAQKAPAERSVNVDRMNTGSINADRQDGKLLFNNGGSRDNRGSDLNTGDYYSGANRPN